MSKIRTTQRLIVEDFPEQKTWIGKLLSFINDFATQTIKAVNGGLVFSENISGVEKDLDLTFITYADSFPIGFRWPLASRPRALEVVQATEDLVPVMISAAWEFTSEGTVQLVNAVKFTTAPAVVALTVGARYIFRIRVTP